MYNSRIYHIHDIQNLNDFDTAYCITCYRYQGATIEDEYNIHEGWRRSFNELYAALSRGRRLDNIRFDYTARTFNVAKENDEPTVLKPRQMAKGEIYEFPALCWIYNPHNRKMI